MSSFAYASPGGTAIRWQEDGASEDAARLRSNVARAVEHLLTAASTGASYLAGSSLLGELQAEASEENWDSRSARALEPLSILAAHRFLALLPTSFPVPYISGDPDGEVSFEWEGRNGSLFSISFSPDQSVAYAGIFGPARVKGIEYFGDDIPQAVIDGLRRAIFGT